MWAFALLGVDDDGVENMCSKNNVGMCDKD